jgi:hypothetical protein
MSDFSGEPEGQQLRTPQDLEDKVSRARAVINALERSFRARRLYETDHPLRQQALIELASQFEEFFARYTYLRLDVTDAELRLAGKTLMQCASRDPEVPFRMYKDGIREIRFHRGLSKQEVVDFLSILDIDSKQLAEMDMDLVSILWAKDFRAIDQITVDEIEMIESESALTDVRDAAGSQRSLAAELFRVLGVISSTGPGIGTGVPAEGNKAEGRREAPPSAPIDPIPGLPGGADGTLAELTIPRRQDPTPYRNDETDPTLSQSDLEAIFTTSLDQPLREIRDEVERESLGTVIEKTLEILADLFSTSKSILAEEVRPLLRGLVGFHVRKGDFARLGHLMRRLQERKFLDRVVGGEALWKELLGELQGPDARKLFLTYLNTAFAADVDGLKLYFSFIDSALLEEACSWYGQIRSAIARGPVKEYLITQGRRNPGAIKGILKVPEPLLPEAMEIYRQVNPSGLAAELHAIFGRLPRTTKYEGLFCAVKTEGVGRVRLFEAALADSDPAVRAHGLKLMGESRSAELGRVVEQWIEAKEFMNRIPGEKALAYTTVARLAGDAGLTYLKELAERKPSLFDGSKAAETRRAALQAVCALDTTGARRLLEEWAAKGDRQLKEWAAEALKSRG